MSNPYKIKGPALISFSGGRTSGYMLHKILQAHDGVLPEDVFVVFANTGKEAEQTLEFVDKCSKEWNVNVRWLEHYFANERPKHRTKEVCFKTAARNGEPFERLIDDRKFLPNPVARFCTSELKINVMARFMRSHGHKEWFNVLGLRYDEPHRAVRARNQQWDKWINICPMYDAKETNDDVLEFWDKNSFDLKLTSVNGKTLAGNCDLCYLKAKSTLIKILEEEPERADWWIKQEQKFNQKKGVAEKDGPKATFRKDRNFIQLVEIATGPKQELFIDDDSFSCFCHD